MEPKTFHRKLAAILHSENIDQMKLPGSKLGVLGSFSRGCAEKNQARDEHFPTTASLNTDHGSASWRLRHRTGRPRTGAAVSFGELIPSNRLNRKLPFENLFFRLGSR